MWYPSGPEEGIGFLGTGFMGAGNPFCLQEQQVFLTAEHSLLHHHPPFRKFLMCTEVENSINDFQGQFIFLPSIILKLLILDLSHGQPYPGLGDRLFLGWWVPCAAPGHAGSIPRTLGVGQL